MHAIFFLPGILGSKLLLGTEEVWPPTLSEITFGYERINKLVDPACVPGEVIRQVCIRPIYGPILDDLRELVGGDATHVREFPYDWRRDIRETADDFAAALEATVANGAEHVSVVAHSMGGLVARLALEDPRHAASPWLAKVSDLLLLAAPQLGAPLALARALGLGSVFKPARRLVSGGNQAVRAIEDGHFWPSWLRSDAIAGGLPGVKSDFENRP